MAEWLYHAAQATLSLVRTPRAHENLRHYAKVATLPEMRLALGAPAIPSPEEHARVERIHHLQHEMYRTLANIDSLTEFNDNVNDCKLGSSSSPVPRHLRVLVLSCSLHPQRTCDEERGCRRRSSHWHIYHYTSSRLCLA